MLWYGIRYRINKWKTIEGVFIPVYIRYGYSVIRFINDGSYECQELRILKEKLVSSDRVIELGTGIGFIAAQCARLAGDDSVFTFEANGTMEPAIRELFRKNNVNPYFEVAMLTDSTNPGFDFTISTDYLASSQKRNDESGMKINIPVLDINSAIRKIKPTYLVMDIEGNEYEAIKDITDFGTITKIQFELHPKLLSTEKIEFIFQKLERYNFIKDTGVSTETNFFFERR